MMAAIGLCTALVQYFGERQAQRLNIVHFLIRIRHLNPTSVVGV
jgi:hypothetical protein